MARRQAATAASDDFIRYAAAAVRVELPRHVVRRHELDPANMGIFERMYSGGDDSMQKIGQVLA
jgi:hypothetical protein